MEAISPSKARPEWMKCQQSPHDSSAVVCDLQNLAPGELNRYQLSIATNQPHPAKAQSLTSVVEILPYDKYLDRKILIFCVVSLGIFFGSFPLIRRFRSWLEVRRLTRQFERETFKSPERKRSEIFDSDEERDALNRAIREDTVHSKR
jgi:hypothetical protein